MSSVMRGDSVRDSVFLSCSVQKSRCSETEAVLTGNSHCPFDYVEFSVNQA